MTRVLYDTTVFLNGLLNPHGNFPRLFELPDDVQLVLSDSVAEEIFKVILQSSHLRSVLPTIQEITLEDIGAFISEQNMVPLEGGLGIDIDICGNTDDNKYLVSALALGCDCLVTAIPDLLALEGNKNWEEFLASNDISVRVLDADTFASML